MDTFTLKELRQKLDNLSMPDETSVVINNGDIFNASFSAINDIYVKDGFLCVEGRDLLLRLSTNRSSRWPKVRAAWLLSHPFCAACGKREMLEVHHIFPFSWPGGAELELVESNFITLCESPGRNCHLWVGHLGDYKARNPDVIKDAAEQLLKIKNRPYPEQISRCILE